ncbi:MAG: cytochrome c1, partial [Burkholderiaceae bacterium]
VRYNKLRDLGLKDDQIKGNLILTQAKFGDPILTTLPLKGAKEWFGKTPPALSLTARSRSSGAGTGGDWIYTYMRTYYEDSARPTGWNNKVYPAVGMPHVLWEVQKTLPKSDYDNLVADLTAFLVWVAEPVAQTRKQVGVWVLLFLALFFVFAWRLNAAFWKDIK